MATVVQKYGGSSVADVGRLKRVAEQVVARRRSGDRVVVVVSAMGKTTDALIAQARQVTAEPPQRELDMLVTVGERIAMSLLSMAIQELGEDAISFTGSQSGIITDANHQDARILQVRPFRIEEELDRGRVVIVAGYQGVSVEREVTTLGRGGSDTTAVALAAALEADACEIYSDVDGVYSADPNICPQARHLPELSYETMQTMAGAGAKVLNAAAVEFARRAGISIHARKSGDIGGRQTVVSRTAQQRTGVTAVVGAAEATRVLGEPEDLGAALDAILDVSGRVLAFSRNDDADILIERSAIPGRSAAPVQAVAAAHGLRAVPASAVSLVGSGLLDASRAAAQALAVLSDAAVAVQAVYASDPCLCIAMQPGQSEHAVRALHAAFVQAC